MKTIDEFIVTGIEGYNGWNLRYDKVEKKDIHFDHDYLEIYSNYVGHPLYYFIYGSEEEFIMEPLLLRELDMINGYDLSSPWYYGGLLTNVESPKRREELYFSYRKEMEEYCKENKIVSEFVRCNPVTRNHRIIEDKKNLHLFGSNVYIDLTKDIESIASEYNKKTMKNLKSAKNKGFDIYHSKSRKDYEEFIKLYIMTMKRLKAKDFYFFSNEFFNDLWENYQDNVNIFILRFGDDVICATLDLAKYGVVHDYLRGTDYRYMRMNCNYLMIDFIIKWAKENGFKEFNMGGGRTGKECDSLLQFKNGFSKTCRDRYFYKKIFDPGLYEKLCVDKGLDKDCINYEKAEYFPEYRTDQIEQ